MNITYISISKLKTNEKNPRRIVNEQFEKLCKNIERRPDFFAKRPCLVNKKDGVMLVYAGNQRLRAAKKLGWKEVPCIVNEDLSEEIIKEEIILDNVHHGDHDYDMLACDYDVGELIDLGMLEKELGMAIEDIEEVEGKPEKKKKLKMCPQCGNEFN